MTTSKTPAEGFVWVWLPGAEEPVVAGRLEAVGDLVEFNYGRSFLARDDAIALYLPELPLRAGRQVPLDGLFIPGCISDASPDAWGQRVIMRNLLGDVAPHEDPAALGPLTYLLRSGSNRPGALDFQASPSEYESRSDDSARLEDLLKAAELVDQGLPLPAALDLALLHGSSIGGARPKAILDHGGRQLIAKFSASSDTYPVVKAEFAAMRLALRAGLAVAPVELVKCLGRDVLLVERFDRVHDTKQRRAMVSALTILQLDEMMARYASYLDLAQVMRARFKHAKRDLRELFARITFNILVGNTDDHARNHAAFWDGTELDLTPAYDICPQARTGGEATQAMGFGPDGFRFSRVESCVRFSANYLLSRSEARAIIDHQIEVIATEWADVAKQAELTQVERDYFWRRQFLNPYALQDYAHPRIRPAGA